MKKFILIFILVVVVLLLLSLLGYITIDLVSMIFSILYLWALFPYFLPFFIIFSTIGFYLINKFNKQAMAYTDKNDIQSGLKISFVVLIIALIFSIFLNSWWLNSLNRYLNDILVLKGFPCSKVYSIAKGDYCAGPIHPSYPGFFSKGAIASVIFLFFNSIILLSLKNTNRRKGVIIGYLFFIVIFYFIFSLTILENASF